MDRIVVVTDSSATVPAELVEELDIRVVPMLIAFRNQSFRDGVDITPGQVYRRLRANKHIPTTAAPSVGDFLRVYASAGQTARGIVSIHVPSWLSATYDTAVLASRLVDDVPIRVVECTTAAMGQGFAVIEAARAAAAGAELEQVVARAEQVESWATLNVIVGTLKYLHRGGRIGAASALLGSMLQIKPILYLGDGRVEVLAKARTKERAVEQMLGRMAEAVTGFPVHAAVMHADVPEEAEALKQQVAQRFDCVELLLTEFTPVMGAHTGPGLLGVVYYVDGQERA
jgi:DegV family protein with EDD domain